MIGFRCCWCASRRLLGLGCQTGKPISLPGPLDSIGGTSCGWTTHESEGKDSKGRKVLKIELPDQGGKAFVIPVKSSGSTVKQPKVFSLPMLAQADLPYDVLIKGWDEVLNSLKLRAREWKFFLEV